jgi:hypothetical protein
MWRKDAHRPSDFDDPAAERVWFANQLSDDACASLAILNIALNCPDIEIEEELTMFKQETESMSPVVGFLDLAMDAGSDLNINVTDERTGHFEFPVYP